MKEGSGVVGMLGVLFMVDRTRFEEGGVQLGNVG